MLSKSDKKWLSQNFATKKDLKALAKQKDLLSVKKDIKSIKEKVNEFASVTLDALGNIADWTQDIHESIVKQNLPERVKKLEEAVFPKN